MARKKQSKNQFFAERLKEMLKKEGIGHSELAMHLGVSREAVNYYTLGKNEPSLQSFATRTAPCAGTSGNRFCPTTQNWKRPCGRCLQSAASTVESPSRSAGEECTAPTNVQMQPGKSRPPPECASTGTKRQCNALARKKPWGATTFRVGFREVVQLYSPTPICPANGYRAQNKNQEIRK